MVGPRAERALLLSLCRIAVPSPAVQAFQSQPGRHRLPRKGDLGDCRFRRRGRDRRVQGALVRSRPWKILSTATPPTPDVRGDDVVVADESLASLC